MKSFPQNFLPVGGLSLPSVSESVLSNTSPRIWLECKNGLSVYEVVNPVNSRFTVLSAVRELKKSDGI